MPRALKIGLTGGIGTGKSEALKAFRAAGADVLCLDSVAHELSRKGGPVDRAIVREFGALSRAELARLVFSRPAARRRLEAITHPPILRRMDGFLRSRRAKVAVADVPLLYEAGLAGRFDATVLVTAPPQAQLKRVMKRGGLSAAQARARIRAQWPLARKERLADVILFNGGSLRDLRRTVREYQRAFELIASS